jgi:dihydrofolate reductase
MTVFVEISMSVDGHVTGPDVSVDQPMGVGGERLHDWMFEGRTAEEATAYQESVFASVGAVLMGRRMLDLGLVHWGDDPTFHAPVFVVTHEPHPPIDRRGGTTYTFVTGGLDEALRLARAAAAYQDIAIVGGADLVRQCLAAGAVDAIRLHVAPFLLGAGTKLFLDGILTATDLTLTSVDSTNGTAHLDTWSLLASARLVRSLSERVDPPKLRETGEVGVRGRELQPKNPGQPAGGRSVARRL